jgi:hypothetical protein
MVMLEATDLQIKKALVTISVEQALLEIGTPVLEEVTRSLYSNYRCYIPDCLDHPDYLTTVFKDLYGKGYLNIVKSIHKHLDEFIDQKPIEKFLIAL